MTQAELTWFDPTGESIREWHRHGAVGFAVRLFFVARMRATRKFHASDLFIYVNNISLVAPDTPNRVMRLMREDGMLDYEVVNRAKSLYRVLGVRVSEDEILGRIRGEL